ncbi:LuxR C-terminal-related transcriptional regulator [Halosquirtibacter laminarini]|uniref:LuxR C-terminal-related transcriptional regulator n=1 Tax=Halosquirtibacter laminarini TaxID=3374600 RepID=A0AC61NHZ7_9BACT|nr:LuxR C-terminal-related transcriptional regulator [Prolixibacteraceae bacterium]
MSDKLNVVIIDNSTIIRDGIEALLNRSFFPLTTHKLSNFPISLDKYIKLKVDLILINGDILWEYTGETKSLFEKLKSKNTPVVGYNIQKKLQKKLFSSHFYLDQSEEEIIESIKSLIYKTQKIVEEDSSNLSTREIEVIRQIIDGNSNKEIAENLFISTHTVITHRKNITQKLGIKSISGLTIYAILHGLVEIDEYKKP